MAKKIFRCLTPASLLSLLVVGSLQPVGHGQMLANGYPLSPTTTAKVLFVPPREGKPQKTTGGASRDSGKCPQDQGQSSPDLLPLIPQKTEALTISERPTFLAYIPPTIAKQAYFSLTKVEDGQHLYHRFIPISRSGVIALPLPDDAPVLEMQSYQWSLSLICGAALAPDSPVVEGTVTRVSLSAALMSQLETLPLSEQAVVLGQQGIWYDTMASLAKSRQQQPHDHGLAQSWQDILQAAGLASISEAPLLDL